MVTQKKRIRKASAKKDEKKGFNIVCPRKSCGCLNTFPDIKKDDIVVCINCWNEIKITKVV